MIPKIFCIKQLSLTNLVPEKKKFYGYICYYKHVKKELSKCKKCAPRLL